MELPVQFVYVENGVEKTSVDENKRMNYIDELNRSLLNYGRDGIQRNSKIKDYINGKKKLSDEEISRLIARYNSGIKKS